MEPISKSKFQEWVKRCNWMLIGSGATPNGPQENYLTPTGGVVIVVYDLKGNLFSVGQVMPAPQQVGGRPLIPRR